MISMDMTKKQFETNVFGVIRCTQAALPVMRAQKSGKIVYISSIGGVWGQCFNDVYCASKFAVEGMAESQHRWCLGPVLQRRLLRLEVRRGGDGRVPASVVFGPSASTTFIAPRSSPWRGWP